MLLIEIQFHQTQQFTENLFQIIASKDNDFELNNSQFSLQKFETSSVGKDLSKEASSERVKNVFFNIEKACIEEKV